MSLGSSIGLTDTGRRRRHNEDSYVCEPPLFAIADGMGGAQAGEVASRLAAAVLNEGSLVDLEGDGLGEARLAELIQEANRRVFQRSNEDAAASGMGTTMTVALVDGDAGTVAIGHVGDSRAYRVRAGALEQLTEDHSLVNELLKSGRLSPEEALSHPQRSVITRAIGTEPDVDVDTFTVDAQPGDLFLLCSDGLTDMITDEEILGLVERSERDLESAARRLVEAANRSGGGDNITVVAFTIAEGAERQASETQTPVPATEDEDTLSGLEGVPVVDTAVLSADDVREHLEAPVPVEPAAQQPRRLLPLLLLVLLLVAIAALVVWGLYR
jgi:PPM family protein phosphatase